MTTLKDFRTKELTGKTHSTADTQKLHYHNARQVPTHWIVLEGNVYVARNGASENYIDIRSPNSSEEFKLLLFFS